jgi:hypothetical protein
MREERGERSCYMRQETQLAILGTARAHIYTTIQGCTTITTSSWSIQPSAVHDVIKTYISSTDTSYVLTDANTIMIHTAKQSSNTSSLHQTILMKPNNITSILPTCPTLTAVGNHDTTSSVAMSKGRAMTLPIC